MSTKKRIVSIQEVTEHFCDRCGAIISDGLHDGLGGINWWGLWLTIKKNPEVEFEIKRGGVFGDAAVIQLRTQYTKELNHVLCGGCAAKLKELVGTFMNEVKPQQPQPETK